MDRDGSNSFSGGSDGDFPQAGVILDAKGNLYGTTSYGGKGPDCSTSGLGGCGTVFRLSPPAAGGSEWKEAVLYRFAGGADGYSPRAPLVLGEHGNLYGTTYWGGRTGKACNYGCGVVFELSYAPSSGWTETVLHAFGGKGDGLISTAGLTFDKSSNLYGTTNFGGKSTNCCGTVFELSPPASLLGPWTETVLHRFIASDGRSPMEGVVFDPSGNLFGATTQGAGNGSVCTDGCGVVFELSPSSTTPVTWTDRLLYRFPGGANGGPGYSVTYQGGNPGSREQGASRTDGYARSKIAAKKPSTPSRAGVRRR